MILRTRAGGWTPAAVCLAVAMGDCTSRVSYWSPGPGDPEGISDDGISTGGEGRPGDGAAGGGGTAGSGGTAGAGGSGGSAGAPGDSGDPPGDSGGPPGDAAPGGDSAPPLCSPALATNGSWQALGASDTGPWGTPACGSASGGGIAGIPWPSGNGDMALLSDGRPFVTWTGTWSDGLVTTWAFARLFDGTDWLGLDGSASGAGLGQFSSSRVPIAGVDAADNPIYAIQTGGFLQVLRFEAGAWGGIAGSDTDIVSGVQTGLTDPVIEVNDAGQIYVLWRDTRTGASEIYLKRYNGSIWEGLGGSDTAGGISNTGSPSYRAMLALDAAGLPVVAWVEETNPRPQVYLKRFAAGIWAEVDGSATSRGISDSDVSNFAAALAIDGADQPVVAWLDASGALTQVFLKGRDPASGWVGLGGSDIGTGLSAATDNVTALDLAYDPVGDALWVAWSDASSGTLQIRARTWGSGAITWAGVAGSELAAGISQSGGSSREPRLRIDALGRPTLLWQDYISGRLYGERRKSDRALYVRRLEASGWVELNGGVSGNGLSATSATAYQPDAAANDLGDACVAWTEGGGIHCRCWDGTQWQELAGSATGAGIPALVGSTALSAEEPAIALDELGNPVVAWEADTNQGYEDIYVARFRAGAWELLPGAGGDGNISNTNNQYSWGPQVASDALGRIVVVWHEWFDFSNRQIFGLRWETSAWQPMAGSDTGGGISASTRTTAEPEVAIDSQGRPVVVYSTDPGFADNILLKRFEAGAWVGVGTSADSRGISDTSIDSLFPAVAIDSQDRPVVAWFEDRSSGAEIYLRRWDGSNWVELGCSAHGVGVSQSGIATESVTLMMDAADRPIVAWEQRPDGPSQIIVRVWEVQSDRWIGLSGAGFAGGVSNSCANSFDPGLIRVGPSTCVAWTEMAAAGQQIVLRCAN